MQTRRHGTDRSGNDFSIQTRAAVWIKAQAVAEYDPSDMRMDIYGALVKWASYGDTTPMGNGWEIDHVYPVAKGGSDNLSNLQALQWQNNRRKSDAVGVLPDAAVVASR